MSILMLPGYKQAPTGVLALTKEGARERLAHRKVIDCEAYVQNNNEKGRIMAAFNLGIPVGLRGPTRTGKSLLLLNVAREMDAALVKQMGHEDVSGHTLIGYPSKISTETGSVPIWIDGPLSLACRAAEANGNDSFKVIFYFDEILAARPEAIRLINEVTDSSSHVLSLPSGELINLSTKNIFFAMSWNPGRVYQQGRSDLEPSLKQRMAIIDIGYPVAEKEQQIILANSGLENSRENIALVTSLVSFANDIRSLKGYVAAPSSTVATLGATAKNSIHDVDEAPGPGTLVGAAKLIAEGGDLSHSIIDMVISPVVSGALETKEIFDALCSLASLHIRGFRKP